MLGEYGAGARNYELFVAFVLDSHRSEIRQSNIVREGIGAAFTDRLSLTWLQAIANAEDEAMAAFSVQGRRMADVSDEDKRRFAEDAEAEAELAEIERLEREACPGQH